MDASTTAYVYEGSTLSLLFVMEYDGRVFVVASNVGDSPVLLVDNETGKVLRLHAEHNWDSVKERKVQLQASREAGRDDAVVIYNRFNCDNGTAFRDHRGGRDIIPMFREGTDEVLEETREHIMMMSKIRKCVGGTQSLRKMKTLCWNATTEEWGEEALKEYGHDNFGSTPLILGPGTDDNGVPIKHGGCQMTRGIGDHEYKGVASGPHVPLVLCKPSVAVKELLAKEGNDYSVVVCSDGVGDAFYWHQMGDVFREVYTTSSPMTSETATTALLQKTLENGRAFRVQNTVRAWDDLSMVVGRLTLKDF
jgi:serine/threonine protein phosphatase PrpC